MPVIAMLLALALVSVSTSGSRGHTDVSAGQIEFEDECFSVRWSRWRDGARSGPLRMREAPRSVWLTDHRVAAEIQGVALRVMRAAPGGEEPGFAAAHWRYVEASRELILEWSTPFQGIQARFSIDSTAAAAARPLVGEAVTWSHRPEDGSQRAGVELIPRRCFR